MTRLLAVTLPVLLAAPATASAATWTRPPAPCYVSVGPAPTERQAVPIRAEGFTPNAPLDLLIDGVPADTDGDGLSDQIYADPDGRVTKGAVPAPHQSRGERPFSIEVIERAKPSNSVAATSNVTALSVRLRPSLAPPSSRVRFAGRGFLKPAAVWGHYVYAGKVRRTVRLAKRPKGACGTFSVRRRQIPITRPRTGHWTLQVDQQKRYAPQPSSVFVRLDINVQLVVTVG